MAITNFIPEVWSAAILEALRAKLVFPSLCNRDYEGDIRPHYRIRRWDCAQVRPRPGDHRRRCQ